MKKITKLKDLPMEQRLRIEAMLNRNRVKTAPLHKHERKIISKSNFTSSFNKNDFEKWTINNLN